MLHSSVVFPVLRFETFFIQPKLTGHFSLPLGIAIYWIYLHFLCFPSGQLIYYTTNLLFCQGVFRKFFRFFVIFLRFSASYKAFRNFLSFFVHFIWKKRNSLPLRFHLLFDYLLAVEKEHAITQSVPAAVFGKIRRSHA